jgi:hypothetical protein
MADFEVERGTTWRLSVTLDDGATPTPAPIDISEAVIRFAMKRDVDQSNSSGIFLTSYDSEEIQITDGPNGAFTVTVLPHLTDQQQTGLWHFAIEINRKLGGAQTTGLANVTGGAATFAISTGDIAEIFRNSIIEFTAGANAGVRVVATAVTASPDTVTSDNLSLVTDAAQAYSAFNGDSDVPDAICGTVELLPNPVK